MHGAVANGPGRTALAVVCKIMVDGRLYVSKIMVGGKLYVRLLWGVGCM